MDLFYGVQSVRNWFLQQGSPQSHKSCQQARSSCCCTFFSPFLNTLSQRRHHHCWQIWDCLGQPHACLGAGWLCLLDMREVSNISSQKPILVTPQLQNLAPQTQYGCLHQLWLNDTSFSWMHMHTNACTRTRTVKLWRVQAFVNAT